MVSDGSMNDIQKDEMTTKTKLFSMNVTLFMTWGKVWEQEPQAKKGRKISWNAKKRMRSLEKPTIWQEKCQRGATVYPTHLQHRKWSGVIFSSNPSQSEIKGQRCENWSGAKIGKIRECPKLIRKRRIYTLRQQSPIGGAVIHQWDSLYRMCGSREKARHSSP